MSISLQSASGDMYAMGAAVHVKTIAIGLLAGLIGTQQQNVDGTPGARHTFHQRHERHLHDFRRQQLYVDQSGRPGT